MFNLNNQHLFLQKHVTASFQPSRPGCWAYPDMLQVGNGNMSLDEARTHFAAWVVTSAPLILGFDLTDRQTYQSVYPIVSNQAALQISATWTGKPGALIANNTATPGCYFDAITEAGAKGDVPKAFPRELFACTQIWAKPLAKGAYAVLLINLSEKEQDVKLEYTKVDVSLGNSVAATNVWTGAVVPTKARATVFPLLAPHSSIFLNVDPAV